MMYLPTKGQITEAKNQQPWDFGNDILYKLCRENFHHKDESHILAKVLFIGRIYAAAVERRKNKADEINDEFYLDVIIPTFKNSGLDEKLDILNRIIEPSIDDLPLILETHGNLTKTLFKITGLDKRSFSSKYLHFHLPKLYFIYDSRALKGLRSFINRVPKEYDQFIRLRDVDEEYSKFYCKCHAIKKQAGLNYNTSLTNREFDNILIGIANKAKKK